MTIRDLALSDAEDVLRLNAEFEHFLSPLSARRLQHLLAQSSYRRVALSDGRVVAFLLAFREGADYDSPNYLWFAAHRERFLYIDRIVVEEDAQGQGLASRLYGDLFEFARQAKVACVTCEFDLDPPNPGSGRFHRRLGFVEIGRQQVGEGRKTVSLQELRL